VNQWIKSGTATSIGLLVLVVCTDSGIDPLLGYQYWYHELVTEHHYQPGSHRIGGFKYRETRWASGLSALLVRKVPGSKHSLCTEFFNNSLCSPSSKMSTWLSSELEKVKLKGGEEEEWCPTLVTPLPETSWIIPNSHFPDGHSLGLWDKLNLYKYSLLTANQQPVWFTKWQIHSYTVTIHEQTFHRRQWVS